MKEPTIAVLPFVNMSSDPENAYFSDGITEEIIIALAGIQQLKVTSRTSSFAFKSSAIPIKDIAKQLGVAVILEGSVRRSGAMVRINAKLIQADEDVPFWSETWDRQLDNMFEVQDEVSLLIADKLREQLGHFEVQEHLVPKQTDNLAAYDLAMQARYHFNQWNPQHIHQAIELYQQALALDPQHTDSHVGLADAYGFMATTEFMPREETWQKAADCTQRALALNPDHAGALYQLANVKFYTELDIQQAVSHSLRAIALRPGFSEAHQFLAFLYTIADELDQAQQHLDLANDINPLSEEVRFFQAYHGLWRRNISQTLDMTAELLRRNPFNLPAYVLRCLTLLLSGEAETALQLGQHMPEEIAVPGDQLGITCLAQIQLGHQAQAAESFRQLQQRAQVPSAFQEHSYLFMAMARRGQFDEAFAFLAQAIEWRSSVLPIYYNSPLLDPIKQDPRFAQYQQQLFPAFTAVVPASSRKAPLLDMPTAERYTHELLRFMTDEEPFLDPQLSLRNLAEQVQIHPNQLSWLLNQNLGQNFNEFVNQYRVDRFKQLAVNPANQHISLIGLAYESGFHSKSVFNTYFKKAEGMTPSAFVKQNQ